ncbi:MAG: hypothetical protein E6363_02755, partial [Enterobacter sp.]|nr:hypothetical protein [Enterobacter sp.]
SVGMVLANRCHRQNMKTSIINGSEVSRLSVAIQISVFFVGNYPDPEGARALSSKAIKELAKIVLVPTRQFAGLTVPAGLTDTVRLDGLKVL